MRNIYSMIFFGIILSISLTQFLSIDNTNEHSYINDTYVCYDFCRDLIFSASKYHIYLDYIYVPERNHMMVGLYNPVNQSILIIEPQNDNIVGSVPVNNNEYIRISVWDKNIYYLNSVCFTKFSFFKNTYPRS